MKQRLFSLLLLFTFLLGSVGVSAQEVEDISEEGNAAACGEKLGWMIEDTTLTITGTGNMFDFPDGAPWDAYKDTLTKVVLSGGVTSVGAYAFDDYDKLTEVDLGAALVELGKGAFKGCDGLTALTFPKSFKKFGEDSLRSCKKLVQIHCEGGFPRFDENSLWDTYCIIYYPAKAPWSVKLIEQLETAFQGRIEFLDSNGKDHYTPTEPTEETTVPTTEATTEPVTEATEPETVPETTIPETTVPITVPETTEATQSTKETFLMGTEAVQTTQPAPQKTEKHVSPGLLIVAGALAVTGLAVLIFKAGSRR